MLAKVNKSLKPILWKWDIDLVVDFSEVLTSAEAFRSDHVVSDGEDDGGVGEAVGVKCLIGNNLFEEDGVGPLIDRVVAGLVGQ